MTTYRVTVWREPEGGWGASADEIDGAHTDGRSLAEIDRHIREAIALVLDLPRGAEDTMDVALHIRVGDDIDALVDDARRARQAAKRAQALTIDAVQALRKRGVSVRDAARVLGITSGRVSQLEKSQATPRTGGRAA